jgi:hypothetical protein
MMERRSGDRAARIVDFRSEFLGFAFREARGSRIRTGRTSFRAVPTRAGGIRVVSLRQCGRAPRRVPMSCRPSSPASVCPHDPWSARQRRMLTARAITSATVTTEIADCASIVTLAHWVMGMVSVGLNAVALVNET